MVQSKTWLVTGAAGFIGSSFAAQCAARKERVIVLDSLTYAGHRENLEWIEPKEFVTLVVGTICDGNLVEKLLKEHNVDGVVNFAAESHVDNSIKGPGVFIETNVNGTFQMLEASRRYWSTLTGAKKDAFRFVQVSTDEVYGSLGPTGKFTEKSPMQPNSPYSASKAAGDHLARAWFETYHMPTIVTNCTNNYGPRQFPEKLIPAMITRGLAGQPLGIYGKGENIRDWIHVEDHTAGVYLALTKGKPGETYCFGGNSERTNVQVVEAICAALDALRPRKDGKSYREQITFVADRPGHDFRYAIDDSKAEKELGYKRRYLNFEQGLKATIEWYLTNTAWCDSVTKKKKAA